MIDLKAKDQVRDLEDYCFHARPCKECQHSACLVSPDLDSMWAKLNNNPDLYYK